VTRFRWLQGWPSIVLASLVGFGAAAVVFRTPEPVALTPEQAQFRRVVQLLRTSYVDEMPAGELYGRATGALVKSLHDPFTELMTADAYVRFSAQVAGRPVGSVAASLRAAIPMPSADAVMLSDGQTGYLALRSITEQTATEVRGAVNTLTLRGMRSLVLDLRGNPGGLVAEAAGVAELFLEPGLRITALRGRTARFTREYTSGGPQLWPSLPVVIIVDQSTASSAELIAGALQEHGRARVVGTRTFGKGVIQTTFPLDGGGALKLTTSRWYTPHDRNVNRPGLADGATWAADSAAGDAGGIVPDVTVHASRRAGPERHLMRALGPDAVRFREAVDAYAAGVAEREGLSVDLAFEPDAAMLAGLYATLPSHGIDLERDDFDRARAHVSRQLAYAVTRLTLGAEAELARRSLDDHQLGAALALLARIR
jgi:carboxyl-terminal processing protease